MTMYKNRLSIPLFPWLQEPAGHGAVPALGEHPAVGDSQPQAPPGHRLLLPLHGRRQHRPLLLPRGVRRGPGPARLSARQSPARLTPAAIYSNSNGHQ